MNDLRILLGTELRSLYGINRLRHTRDKKEKNRGRLLAGVWAYLAVVVIAYVGGLVFGLCTLGLGAVVPSYLAVTTALLIFFFGIFKAGNTLFGRRGYDLLSSLPVRTGAIVGSRLAVLYLEDLVLSALILLPGMTVYGVLQKPSVAFYLVGLLGVVLLPAIPLAASILVGTLIMAASARMRHKSLVQSLLTVVFVVVILVGSFRMGNLSEGFTEELLADLAARMAELFDTLYPPAAWLGNAMQDADIVGLALFVTSSVGALILCLLVTVPLFHCLTRALGRVLARKDYKLGRLEHRGLLRALYLREAKRYFSSSIYVTNTIIGPVLACILSVALCIVGMETVEAAMPAQVPVRDLLPVALAAVFCMMTTTACSISMEGKQMDLVKSLPIPVKTWLDSKLLLDLSLILPCYAVSEICLILALRPTLGELVWTVAIPLLLLLFSVVLGIAVDLKFHRFDWEKEEQVVKQGASAMLGGFAGVLAAFLTGAVIFVVPTTYAPSGKLGVCLVLAASTALLYRRNNRTHMEKL